MIDYSGETLEALETYKREADLAEAFKKAGMPESLAKVAAVGIVCDSPGLLKKAVDRHHAAEWQKRERELELEKQREEHGRQPEQPEEQMSSQDLEALEREVSQSMGMYDQDDPFLQGFADPNAPFRKR